MAGAARSMADLANYAATFLRGQTAARTPLTPGPPVVLLVGITNRCNLRCGSCFHASNDVPPESRRPKGRMPKERFARIASEARGWVSYLEIGLFGEPALHPDLSEMVRLASSLGVPTGVVTNGTLLHGDRARSLVEAGASAVSLSIDGSNPEEFEELRSGASWRAFSSAVRSLADARRALGTASPHIVVRGIDPGDAVGRSKAVAWERDLLHLGADQVLWAVPHDWTGSLVSVRSTREMPPIAERTNLCTYPWVMMAVDWDGAVVPCCADFSGKNELGNVDETPLRALWRGRDVDRLRSALKSRDRAQIRRETGCAGCSMLSQPTLSARSSLQLTRQAVSEAWRRSKDRLGVASDAERPA